MDPLYHPTQDIPIASGIYRITCTTTEKFYIGSTVNLRKRWHEHHSELRRGIHKNSRLQNAWDKYGEQAFVFEVLELVLIRELLTAREQHWLDKFKPCDRNKGFNLTPTAGSSLGIEFPPEIRAKMSKVHLGKKFSSEHREKIRNAALKRRHSDETKRKMSQTRQGSAKTYILIDPNGTEYTIRGLDQFCREHGLHTSTLIQVAKGKHQHYKGWKARQIDTD